MVSFRCTAVSVVSGTVEKDPLVATFAGDPVAKGFDHIDSDNVESDMGINNDDKLQDIVESDIVDVPGAVL